MIFKRFILISSLLLATFALAAQTNLKPQDFQKTLASAKDPVLVDVRTPGEFTRGHLEGATLIDVSQRDAAQKLNRLPKNQPIFVYCLSGSRSADAAYFLKKQGFTNVYNLSGGVMSWNRAGLPMAKTTAAIAKPDWTTERLKSAVNKPKPVIVNFYAPWCAPCKKMEPGFFSISKDFAASVDLLKIDLDKNAALAETEKVPAIPVTRVYKGGRLIIEKNGFLSDEEIRNLFELAKKS